MKDIRQAACKQAGRIMALNEASLDEIFQFWACSLGLSDERACAFAYDQAQLSKYGNFISVHEGVV